MRALRTVQSWLLACCALCFAISLPACGDDGNGSSDEAVPLVVDNVVGDSHQAGGLVAVAGNFIANTPDDLELEFLGEALPIRLLTPSRVIANIPLEASTNVLEVAGGTDSRQLNLAIEQPDRTVVIEAEDNDDPESAQQISWGASDAARIIRATTDPATEDGPGLDHFLIQVSDLGNQESLVIRVDQCQHRRDVPLTLVVAYHQSGEIGRIKSAAGEDISLLAQLANTDLLITIEAPMGWEGARYDIEMARLPPFEARPTRGVAFFPDAQDVVFPPQDLDCDQPAVLDLNDDDVPDVFCDSLPDGSSPVTPLRGVMTRWGDLNDDGELDAFVLGPGPRTHRMVLSAATAGAEERTEATGLSSITGLTLSNVHFADLDGDGLEDFIAVPRTGAPKVFHNKDGHLEPWQPWQSDPFPPGIEVRASAVFDVDNDGDMDWFMLIRDEQGQGSLRLANDGGQLSVSDPPLDPFVGYGAPTVLAPIHQGDDRFVDLLVADAELGVFLHQGDGGFGTGAFEGPTQLADIRHVHQASYADLNADGERDFLLSTWDGVVLLLREGEQLFDWRALAGLPLGLGALSAATHDQSGTPQVLLDGQLHNATVGSFKVLVVRVEDGGIPVRGAQLEVSMDGDLVWDQLGMQGTGFNGAMDEAVFYFPADSVSPISVEVVFPDGQRQERRVLALPETLVFERP